jgi:hypothetical protein
VELAGVVGIEPQKIYEFARRIYFGLVGVFALSQHSSRIYNVPILASQQLCHTQKYSCSLFPRHIFPLGFGGKCGGNGLLYVLLGTHVVAGYGVLVVVGRVYSFGTVGAYFFAIYKHWNVYNFAAHLG